MRRKTAEQIFAQALRISKAWFGRGVSPDRAARVCSRARDYIDAIYASAGVDRDTPNKELADFVWGKYAVPAREYMKAHVTYGKES